MTLAPPLRHLRPGEPPGTGKQSRHHREPVSFPEFTRDLVLDHLGNPPLPAAAHQGPGRRVSLSRGNAGVVEPRGVRREGGPWAPAARDVVSQRAPVPSGWCRTASHHGEDPEAQRSQAASPGPTGSQRRAQGLSSASDSVPLHGRQSGWFHVHHCLHGKFYIQVTPIRQNAGSGGDGGRERFSSPGQGPHRGPVGGGTAGQDCVARGPRGSGT